MMFASSRAKHWYIAKHEIIVNFMATEQIDRSYQLDGQIRGRFTVGIDHYAKATETMIIVKKEKR